MKKTIINLIDIVTVHETNIEHNFHMNYDDVYSPLFKRLAERHAYFESLKGRKDIKVNTAKKEYDIEQGLRDEAGVYIAWSLSELSQYTQFGLMTKKAFLKQIALTGGNTLKTAYKNMKASERAAKNSGKKAKNEIAKKAAKTREENKLTEAMNELTEGFLICQKAFEISQSENYGNLSTKDIEEAAKKIVSAMLKDNGISAAKQKAYNELKKTG